MNRAFSLIELSIVLVILGLLTGGILAGRSLVHAAELRAVSSEFSRYQTAARAFRDKYFQNAGDINNAVAFWGQMANCHALSTTAASAQPLTCNGSGDGYIGIGDNTITFINESKFFWQHLANAGLIEGAYTGVTGSSIFWHGLDPVLKVNTPASKLTNGGWEALPLNMFTAGFNTFGSFDVTSVQYVEGEYGNVFAFGAANGNYGMSNTILSPEDAWNIDSKMDDGKPGAGKIVVFESNPSCYVLADGSAGSASSSVARTDIIYKLGSNTVACALLFRQAY